MGKQIKYPFINGQISEEFEKDKRVAEVAISATLIEFISKYQIRNFTLNTDSFSVSTDKRAFALRVNIEID